MSFPACSHANKKDALPVAPPVKKHPSFIAFVCGEPFRVMFPLGLLAGILGVLMWPAFYGGLLKMYPVLTHPRIMIECFLGCFVIGFLGTAGPRMLEAPRLTPVELILFFAGQVACATLHWNGLWQAGDSAFLCLMILLLGSLMVRALFFRKNLPPPPLALAVAGPLCGITGVILFKAGMHFGADVPLMRLAQLLLFQGFLLLPIMGIGTFFFPRLLAVPPNQKPPGITRWMQMLGVVLAVIASFAVEAWISVRTGLILRGTVCGVFLLREIQWSKPPQGPRGTLATAMTIALVCMIAGFFTAAIFPTKHVTLEHLFYITGYGLLTLTVATRVVLGHSGDIALAGGRLWVVRVIVCLLIMAALTRIVADFIPALQVSHYQYAAWLTALVFLIWGCWHVRRFFRPDPED